MSDFSSVYCSILFKMVWMTFCKNSSRISCQIIFVNKHWLQWCPSPFKKQIAQLGIYYIRVLKNNPRHVQKTNQRTLLGIRMLYLRSHFWVKFKRLHNIFCTNNCLSCLCNLLRDTRATLKNHLSKNVFKFQCFELQTSGKLNWRLDIKRFSLSSYVQCRANKTLVFKYIVLHKMKVKVVNDFYESYRHQIFSFTWVNNFK